METDDKNRKKTKMKGNSRNNEGKKKNTRYAFSSPQKGRQMSISVEPCTFLLI